MSEEYQQIRTALDRGLYLDNLRHITKLCLAVLQGNPKHPAIPFTIATICRWIADAWDDVGPGIPTAISQRVEQQLKSHLVSLLTLTEADSKAVCAALDEAALAFKEAIRRGLDSDLVGN